MLASTAVGDGVELTPVGIGISASKFGRVVATWEIVAVSKVSRVGHICFSTAVPSTGSPSKEVNPSGVSFGYAVVVVTDTVILVFGKLPCGARCLILKISTGKFDGAGVANRKKAIDSTVVINAS